uniref:Protease regulatory ATPase subunit 4 n=1 Tax=Trypanosoma congolense (strain IL3000) TaxID=1068625 RepID=G0UVW4_TRYCI|nr:protease regulatory ATPase subunit 4 [Trypanosoma congolense IL3000]
MQQNQADYSPNSKREELIKQIINLTELRNKLRGRVDGIVRDILQQEEELVGVMDQANSLMSIGHHVGEILHKVDEERFIVQSISGARHLVGYKKSIKPEQMKTGARVALEITTLTIVRILPREVDPQVYKMQITDNEKNISFQEIGGLQEQMRQMREVVELPLTNPELFVRVGISPPKGVLLYGPPGTGKTLLAKAIASNVDAAFLKIVASSIVDKYIGESARVLREMFAFAREHEPCIIFIDEIDAIGGKRIDGTSSDREVQRTLMELLHQMDGFEKLGKVKVIMATNRPDTLDSALMRPGRLDRKIEIGLPNEAARLDILKIHASKITKAGDIDYDSIVTLSEGFNGADLRNVCTEAGMFALRNDRDYVINEDFNKAARKVADAKKLESAPHQYSEQ